MRARLQRGERGQLGATLVELVVVMALVAVVTGYGAARYASRDPFAVQGAADQLVSGLRLAHGIAVAQRQDIFVVIGSSPPSLQVCLDAACTQPLASPSGDTQWLADTGTLQLGAGAAFTFQASGATSLASALQLTVRNADASVSAQTVVVEPVTGHVHAP